MRWQSGEKASNPQTNTVTATMRGVTSHRASGRKWAGEVSVWKWPELCVGTVVLLSKQRWGRMGCLVVGMSQAATEWNVLSIDIWFTTNQKKKRKRKRKEIAKKQKGETNREPPGRAGWRVRSWASDLSSDPIAKAFAQISQWLLEKTHRFEGIRCCCCLFRFISFRFSLSVDCVSPTLSLYLSL